MKKVLLTALVIFSCLLLSGCGCEKKNETFTISFDSAGGTPVETITVKKGEKAERPDDPTKEGYIFRGWYTNINNGEEFSFSNPITRNITLIAKWEKKSNGDDPKKEEENTKKQNNSNNNSSKKENNESKIVPVTKASFKENDIVVGTSLTKNIEVLIEPENATDQKVIWKSSNPKVATIENGVLKAISEGTTLIIAKVGGKTITTKVKVISLMDAALNSFEVKNITSSMTNINYEYPNCTITNIDNKISDNLKDTEISDGSIKKLYRGIEEGTIKSTYKIVCGEKEEVKEYTHIVPASPYKYNVTKQTLFSSIFKVNDAKDYILYNTLGSNLKYNAKWDGVQTSKNVLKDNEFKMIFNNDLNTTYLVVPQEG